MHSVSLLSALALVGSTLAAPMAAPNNVVVVTKVATVVVTEGYQPVAPTQPPQPPQPPKEDKPVAQAYGGKRPVNTVVVAAPAAKPTEAPKPAPQPSQVYSVQPAPPAASPAAPPKPASSSAAPAPAPSSAPSSGGGDYIDIVNTWRKKMNLPTLQKSSKLEANAEKTCREGNGKMVHQLNEGSMGQVLAPGKAADFEKVFVGGWLCEVPSTPGLGSEVCDKMSQGWNHAGQTGHNEILIGTKNKMIGCAIAGGIWGCDLGNS